MRLLLVEDDWSLAEGLRTALRREGFAVDHVSKGKDALHVVDVEPPDLLILDLGLPDMDGLEVLKQIRQRDPAPLVLVLTARDSIADKVLGLDEGADDYLAKPFEMAELLARLRAQQRRITAAKTSTLAVAGVTLDTVSHLVSVDGQPVTAPRREFMLLKALMENPGHVLSRQQLETRLYGWGEELSSNSIEVHIHHLRKKLPAGFIKTVRGIGYAVPKK